MNFEFTKDPYLIDSCLKSDHVWRMVTDDFTKSINRDLLHIPIEKFLWIKAERYGVFMLEGVDNHSCRIHVALNKESFGYAKNVCIEMLAWLFNNTSYINADVLIPEFNRLAIKLAKDSGMKLTKSLNKSFIKYGKLHDQYLFTIHKGMICG